MKSTKSLQEHQKMMLNRWRPEVERLFPADQVNISGSIHNRRLWISIESYSNELSLQILDRISELLGGTRAITIDCSRALDHLQEEELLSMTMPPIEVLYKIELCCSEVDYQLPQD